MKFTLTLPWPPSNNHYWKHAKGKHYIAPKGKTYRSHVFFAVREHVFKGLCPATPTQQRLAVIIEAFPPDKRKRDLDNLPKAILDALSNAEVWDDDEQIDILTIVRMQERPQGEIRVYVEEITSSVPANSSPLPQPAD